MSVQCYYCYAAHRQQQQTTAMLCSVPYKRRQDEKDTEMRVAGRGVMLERQGAEEYQAGRRVPAPDPGSLSQRIPPPLSHREREREGSSRQEEAAKSLLHQDTHAVIDGGRAEEVEARFAFSHCHYHLMAHLEVVEQESRR